MKVRLCGSIALQEEASGKEAAKGGGMEGTAAGISAKKRKMLKDKGYICREMLGKGAFSEVYRAEDGLGKVYACKISGNPGLLEREACVMKDLKHPLFPVFGTFWVQEQIGFLIMEYIPGTSLEVLLGRRGGFSPCRTAGMGMELAGGLLYLHERSERYLFRDIKPSNIIIRQDGRVKLLDFGCVCPAAEKRRSAAGTPCYAAPEQLEGCGKLTEACDVYGLGRTLEAVLDGKPPGVSRAGKRGRRGGRGMKCKRGKYKKRMYGEKRYERELREFLDACTRQKASERVSNMRDVMAALAELDGAGGGAWRREACCRKNIWESMHKMS